jgi:hypothetical protein
MKFYTILFTLLFSNIISFQVTRTWDPSNKEGIYATGFSTTIRQHNHEVFRNEWIHFELNEKNFNLNTLVFKIYLRKTKPSTDLTESKNEAEHIKVLRDDGELESYTTHVSILKQYHWDLGTYKDEEYEYTTFLMSIDFSKIITFKVANVVSDDFYIKLNYFNMGIDYTIHIHLYEMDAESVGMLRSILSLWSTQVKQYANYYKDTAKLKILLQINSYLIFDDFLVKYKEAYHELATKANLEKEKTLRNFWYPYLKNKKTSILALEKIFVVENLLKVIEPLAYAEVYSEITEFENTQVNNFRFLVNKNTDMLQKHKKNLKVNKLINFLKLNDLVKNEIESNNEMLNSSNMSAHYFVEKYKEYKSTNEIVTDKTKKSKNSKSVNKTTILKKVNQLPQNEAESDNNTLTAFIKLKKFVEAFDGALQTDICIVKKKLGKTTTIGQADRTTIENVKTTEEFLLSTLRPEKIIYFEGLSKIVKSASLGNPTTRDFTTPLEHAQSLPGNTTTERLYNRQLQLLTARKGSNVITLNPNAEDEVDPKR